MRVTVDRKELLAATKQASRAITNRATLPVLAGLRLESDGERLEVAGTDLDLVITQSVPCTNDESGRVVVEGAKFFAAILGKLKGAEVMLVDDDGYLKIMSGSASFRVKLADYADYPALPEVPADAETFALEAASSQGIFSQVLTAASTDEARQVLTGVAVDIGKDSLTFAATDSYRLAMRELEIPAGALTERRLVASARGLYEVLKAIPTRHPETVGDVTISLGENHLAFQVGATTIVTRSIEGDYLNYRHLLPKGAPNRLEVEQAELLEVVGRVGLMAQNNLPIKLQLGAEVEVSAHTPDVGEASEILNGSSTYAGDPLVIAFNPGFTADGLVACGPGRVVVEVCDGLKPVTIRNMADPGFTYLLMPVRLS